MKEVMGGVGPSQTYDPKAGVLDHFLGARIVGGCRRFDRSENHAAACPIREADDGHILLCIGHERLASLAIFCRTEGANESVYSRGENALREVNLAPSDEGFGPLGGRFGHFPVGTRGGHSPFLEGFERPAVNKEEKFGIAL
jgi:hypothetical protein